MKDEDLMNRFKVKFVNPIKTAKLVHSRLEDLKDYNCEPNKKSTGLPIYGYWIDLNSKNR